MIGLEAVLSGKSLLQRRHSQHSASMKIVVAYSGGLDTSVILNWLKETYSAEVIAFCANIGQEEELDGLEEKALQTGASKCYIDDLREEFARDFIFPIIQAAAIYEGQYLLGTSIARPLIAKRMVDRRERGRGCGRPWSTGKGNDQVRFELTAAALAPRLKVIAPWRDERFRSKFPGRAEMIAYCEERKIPCRPQPKSRTRWTAIFFILASRVACSKIRGLTPPRPRSVTCTN